MPKRQLDLGKTRAANPASSLSLQDLKYLSNDWLSDGQFRLHSPATIATRRIFIKNLVL
jgi:hypothetical protein